MEKVIVLIHGVESNAQGMRDIKKSFYDDPEFPKDEKYVEVHDYGHFPAIYSALPWYSTVRETYADYVQERLKRLKCEYTDASIEVLCHSFGTYLLIRALKGEDLQIDKAVMLGSVLPTDLDFSDIQVDVVKNYTGELDFVQYIATWATALFGTGHFGMSGYYGFDSDQVENVNPPGLWTHTSYSEPENIDYIKKEF